MPLLHEPHIPLLLTRPHPSLLTNPLDPHHRCGVRGLLHQRRVDNTARFSVTASQLPQPGTRGLDTATSPTPSVGTHRPATRQERAGARPGVTPNQRKAANRVAAPGRRRDARHSGSNVIERSGCYVWTWWRSCSPLMRSGWGRCPYRSAIARKVCGFRMGESTIPRRSAQSLLD